MGCVCVSTLDHHLYLGSPEREGLCLFDHVGDEGFALAWRCCVSIF